MPDLRRAAMTAEACHFGFRGVVWFLMLKKSLMVAGVAGLMTTAFGVLTPNNIRMALDVPTSFRGSNFRGSDAVSAGADFAGPLFSLNFPGRERLNIDALCVRSNLIVFSTDVDFILNGVNYADEDLLAYNYSSGTYTVFLKGATAGIPASADINAACFIPGTSNLLLSFDTAVTLPGAGLVKHNDIVRYQAGTFTKVYDGATDLGLRASADIDGLFLSGNLLYYSLDISFKRGALEGTDKDVWVFNTNTLATTLMTGIGLAPGVDLADLDELLDSDGDGLSDLEEITGVDESGTTIPGSALAMSPSGFKSNPFVADSDGDGIPDGEEAVAGTSPTNNTDFLRITSLSLGPDRIVRWASVNGKVYDIQAATNLSGFNLTVAASVDSAGTSTAITNTLPDEILFYRVRVNPQ